MENKKIFIFETPYDYHGLSEVIVIASNLEEAVKKIVERVAKEYSYIEEVKYRNENELLGRLISYRKEIMKFFEENKIPKYKIIENLEDFIYFNLGCDC